MEGQILWDKYEKFLSNEGLTKLRIKKLKVMFVTIIKGLKHPEKAQRSDIEKFLEDINKNKIVKRDGNPYSATTKLDIKKFLKQFYKWLKGNNELYPPEVAWIKLRIAKDELPSEKEVLNPPEIIKLVNSFNDINYRMGILLLFDSGFRISELMSVKNKDLTFEEFDSGNKCFWLACNDSKTFIRKIPVSLFTDEIRDWCKNTDFDNKNKNDLLFNFNPDTLRIYMKEKSFKLFGKKISIHNLRHSSATYYAKILDGNSMALAQRYGWTFSSKQLATYIRRSGAYNKLEAKAVFNTKLSDLKSENEVLKDEISDMKKEMLEMKKFLRDMAIEGKIKRN